MGRAMGLVIFWVVMGVIAGLIAKSRGRDMLPWTLYGIAIWPIAIVHALLLKQEPGTERGL